MDIQRRLLIIALAIVAYLIVLQWSKDYGHNEQPQTAAAQSSQSAQGKASADVPSVDSKPEPTTAQATEPAASTDLIQVRTDALQLAIDPRGGDIVQLRLPLYPRSLDHRDQPFQLLDNEPGKLYYVAQSGLTGANGPDARTQGRPLYTSAQRSYQLADGQDKLVVDLHFSDAGVNYTKRFTFHRGLNTKCTAKQIAQHKFECMNEDGYRIEVSYLIDNQSSQPWNGNFFAQLQRDDSKDPSRQAATSVSTYLGAAMGTKGDPFSKVSKRSMDKHDLRENVQGGWIAWLQHYFVSAWVPKPDSSNVVQTRKNNQGNYLITTTGSTLTVAPGKQGNVGATLFAGPKIQKHLGDLAPGLELTVDYGFLWFLAQPIFWLLQHIHNLIGNWGWSIVILTMLIKTLFLPLSASSYRSMARMRAVGPQLQALRDQYADDRQKLSIAMMDLYKKEKINPVGGCLPMLIQMPVFLSLYWVLLESVEIRQAPWILWIADLSIKDPFFVMPIIMGGTMFLQQYLNPPPPDPTQAKVMRIMPIAFTFFFLWFPAGLVLYWIVNNSLSILQQWFISRQLNPGRPKDS